MIPVTRVEHKLSTDSLCLKESEDAFKTEGSGHKEVHLESVKALGENGIWLGL